MNRSSVSPADRNRGDPALTKWFYGFNSRLLLGPVIPKTLKMGVVPACMVLTMKYEVGTTRHNWSARCQYNVTEWVTMWAYDMLSQ